MSTGYALVHVPVSIHAPVKGATSNRSKPMSDKMVSIHAPVKGATPDLYRFVNIYLGFNPRSREGSDDLSAAKNFSPIVFQSTLP